MQKITVTEIELLVFFESDPDRANHDPIWFYDDSIYRAESNGIELSFAIMPSTRDVHLILSNQGVVVYELNATSVKDIQYARETLIIDINSDESFEISIRPIITIAHRYKGVD